MLNISRIKYFIELCHQGNYTKAAESLYISQPALSRQISLLESELGVKLIRHNKKKLQLTPEGASFLKLATEFYEHQTSFELASHNLGSFHTSVLKVGVPVDLSIANTLQAEKEMNLRFPELKIIFRVYREQTKILPDLIAGKLDAALAFRSELGNISRLNYETIAVNYIAVIISEKHRLWGRKSIAPEELRGERIYIPVQELDPGSFIATINYLQQFDIFLSNSSFDRCVEEQILRVSRGDCVSLSHMYGSDLIKSVPDSFSRIPIRNSNIHHGDITLAYVNDSVEMSELINCFHLSFPSIEIN